MPVSVKLLAPPLVVFLSLWTAGTFGFGYVARETLERTAQQETEAFAVLVQQDLMQKQELLYLKARWIAERHDVVQAVTEGKSAHLLRTVLPIQASLDLDLVKIVSLDGKDLLSLQQGALAEVPLDQMTLHQAAQTGMDSSGVLLSPKAAPAAVIGILSLKSSQKILAGLLVGKAIDEPLLQKIRGNTTMHLVALQNNQVTAATLPFERILHQQLPLPTLPPTQVELAGQHYLVKTITLPVLNGAPLKIAVLRSVQPTQQAEQQLWGVVGSFGILGAAIVTGVMVGGLRVTQSLSHRIKSMIQVTQQLANGDLTARLRVQTQDEVGQLAQGFNRMAEQLAARDQQISQQLHQLESTLKELHRTQAQMVQSEKMSALGQMVAGVAHEINNPVNFIHGNLSYVDQYTQDLFRLLDWYQQQVSERPPALQTDEIDLDFLTTDLAKILQSMRVGTDRIREIVISLRNFSRLDEAACKPVDLHEGIDNTLLILRHRLKASADRPEIQVIKAYGALPLVDCYAGQINQVFMNLLANAIDALEESNRGRSFMEIAAQPNQIHIQTQCHEPEWIRITIRDNGVGIPAAICDKLFDPFFTTKPVGKGTGLGLAVSYQVITDKHAGKLYCDSVRGQGTKFVIEIPRCQPLQSPS